jgi:hypothetical protein
MPTPIVLGTGTTPQRFGLFVAYNPALFVFPRDVYIRVVISGSDRYRGSVGLSTAIKDTC